MLGNNRSKKGSRVGQGGARSNEILISDVHMLCESQARIL